MLFLPPPVSRRRNFFSRITARRRFGNERTRRTSRTPLPPAKLRRLFAAPPLSCRPLSVEQSSSPSSVDSPRRKSRSNCRSQLGQSRRESRRHGQAAANHRAKIVKTKSDSDCGKKNFKRGLTACLSGFRKFGIRNSKSLRRRVDWTIELRGEFRFLGPRSRGREFSLKATENLS